VADLKIGILGEMNRNSANDSEREAFSASRERAFLKGYSRPVSRETRRSKQSVVWWRAFDRVRYWIVLIRPNPRTRAADARRPETRGQSREAGKGLSSGGRNDRTEENLCRGEIETAIRISNIDSADPLPSFAASSTQTEPDLSSEIGAIAGGQKRRGYGGESRECSDTDPWRKRAKPILVDLDPVAFADLIALVIK
jgi:hypothetical protein